jgi:hypothetical protein
MKKLLLVLVALLMATPAMADVTITAVEETPGVVAINYAATGDDADGGYSLISGMAIDVTVGAEATIESISDYKDDGESTNGSPGYGIYPGSIQFDVDKQVTSYGDPAAPGTDPGSQGDLPGTACTLELGALYDDEAVPSAQPLATGTLCKLQISGCDYISLALESTHRKGIVLEDGSAPATVNLVVPTEKVGDDCGPPCWFYDCFENGDANGDCVIASGDVMTLVNCWPPLAYDPCGDFNKDGVIASGDVMILVNHWPPLPGCDPGCVPE